MILRIIQITDIVDPAPIAADMLPAPVVTPIHDVLLALCGVTSVAACQRMYCLGGWCVYHYWPCYTVLYTVRLQPGASSVMTSP